MCGWKVCAFNTLLSCGNLVVLFVMLPVGFCYWSMGKLFNRRSSMPDGFIPRYYSDVQFDTCRVKLVLFLDSHKSWSELRMPPQLFDEDMIEVYVHGAVKYY